MQTIAATVATLSSDRPVLHQLLVEYGQRLLDGDALDLEAFVDVLTVKDNQGEFIMDYATALERLTADSVRHSSCAKSGAHDRCCRTVENKLHCCQSGGEYSYATSE